MALHIPLLVVKKDLVVLQHAVVADVLKPLRPELEQTCSQFLLELEREAGKDAALPWLHRCGVHHREDAGKALGCQVMPHQARGNECGVLRAQFSAAGTLLPDAGEAFRALLD